MKVILVLTFVIAVIMTAGIGTLVIFGLFSLDQGAEYLLKSLAAILLLGASSVAIAFVLGEKDASGG